MGKRYRQILIIYKNSVGTHNKMVTVLFIDIWCVACISLRDPEYQFYLPTVCSDAESSVSTEQETVDGLAALKNGYIGVYRIQCLAVI